MRKGLCAESVVVMTIGAVFFVSVVFAMFKIGLG